MSHEDRLARVVLRTMHPSSTPSVLHCIVVFNACPFCLDLRCCGSKCQPPARLPSSASACTGATCRVPSRLDLPELRLIPCMIPGISSAQLIRLWRSVPLFGKTRKAMAPSRKSHTSLCSSIEISIFFRLCFFFFWHGVPAMYSGFAALRTIYYTLAARSRLHGSHGRKSLNRKPLNPLNPNSKKPWRSSSWRGMSPTFSQRFFFQKYDRRL